MSYNGLRLQPAPRPGRRANHVESYFIKLNTPSADRALWVKATLYRSGREPDRVLAEGWAIAFDKRDGANHVAVKETRPFSATSFSETKLEISWEGLSWTDGRLVGSLATKEHRIDIDLEISGEEDPVIPFFHPSMYRGAFPKSKLVTPVPNLVANGHYDVDGERVSVDGWRGMQGHNWGGGHADRYAWVHCNLWDDEDDEVILEALSGQVRVGPVLTPLITIACVRYRGVRYDFHRPASLLKARGDLTFRTYSFSTQSKLGHLEGVFESTTDDMVGLYYANPDGAMTYCLNSKLAHASVRLHLEGRAPLELRSRTAALEIGTRDANHGVRMHV